MSSIGQGDSQVRVVEDGPLALRVGTERPVCFLELFGELDLSNVATLETEIRRAASDGPTTLVVDLSGLDFIDSSGIGLLVRMSDELRRDAIQLACLRGAEAVQRTFEICCVDDLLNFLD